MRKCDQGGGNRLRLWVMQNVTPAPYGGNKVLGSHGLKFFAKFADKHINNLDIRLIPPAVQVVEECLLGLGNSLAQHQQFQNGKFFASQMNGAVFHCNRMVVQVQGQRANLGNGVGVSV